MTEQDFEKELDDLIKKYENLNFKIEIEIGNTLIKYEGKMTKSTTKNTLSLSK
jgi:hypothetical protein